jgi:DNA mismatch endonuclease (patch repair protein)
MVDTLTAVQRSERMSRIRSHDTKPEITLRRELHRRGFRFRLRNASLPGKPDIVLAKYRTAIFVHGCFWHRHPGCKVATTPKSNTEFWIEKFSRNVARDKSVITQLETCGWTVIVIWECELATSSKAAATSDLVSSLLTRSNANTCG